MDFEIASGYIVGALGKITELHALYYSKERGFGLFFEVKVAQELSEFLYNFDPSHDGFWLAVNDGKIIGSVSIVAGKDDPRVARLRWLIVDPHYHGRGIGNRLINTSLDFCRKVGFERLYLTTISGLEPARHLYEKAGFGLVSEEKGAMWGREETEQRFEMKIT